MAPLKFEDSIKEKLEQRTIQPSNGSWDRLEQQLSDKNHHKKVKSYWWLGIAASITGVLILSTIFATFNRSVQHSDIELVDANEKVFEKNQPTEIVTIKSKKQEKIISEDLKDKKEIIQPVVLAKTQDQKNTNFKKEYATESWKADFDKDKIDIQESVIENHSTDVAAVHINSIQEHIVKKDQNLQLDPSIINSKIVGLIEKVKQLEERNKTVTDEEVDALLRKAQQEITTEQILKSNTVSASALLLDVESELDESFKDRVFEALKTGFERLKTSVAERDN